jgi:hypothetical protein
LPTSASAASTSSGSSRSCRAPSRPLAWGAAPGRRRRARAARAGWSPTGRTESSPPDGRGLPG